MRFVVGFLVGVVVTEPLGVIEAKLRPGAISHRQVLRG
jgi:hypothetical protein